MFYGVYHIAVVRSESYLGLVVRNPAFVIGLDSVFTVEAKHGTDI